MIAIPYGKGHLDVAFPYNGLLTSRVDELKSDRTGRELVEEARRVAHNYASSGTSRFSNRWRTLNPIVYTLIGAGTIGLAWLIVALA